MAEQVTPTPTPTPTPEPSPLEKRARSIRRAPGDPMPVYDRVSGGWIPEPIGQEADIKGVRHKWSHEKLDWVPATGDADIKKATINFWNMLGGGK